MIQVFPLAVFSVMFILFFGELIFILLKKPGIAKGFNILGIVACLTGLIYIVIITKRPPLFGAFEASFYIVFILALLVKTSREKSLPLVASIIILLILALQIGKPIVLNDDYYMYDNIWVMLFFNLRLMSAAFFAHAMILCLSYFFVKKDENDSASRTARLYLLSGTFVYLCSEWSGSLWCLNWFGESWLWSHGFFKASMLFLLVMLACHMPPALGKDNLLKTITGSLPGCFALWMIFFH
ncbi:MAG: hypothetical protein K8R67_08685 [Desulfobacteraceae bacterium]|nr:hypothetical protein [Desulfobacteraceae bacterium]